MTWLATGGSTADADELPHRIASVDDTASMVGISADLAADVLNRLIADGRMVRHGDTLYPVVRAADLDRVREVINLMNEGVI